MTEMDVTYIFISYISVTTQRQARSFFRKSDKISFFENKEFVDIGKAESYSNLLSAANNEFEEIILYQELLLNALCILDEMEKHILYEKYINQRSDFDIGKDFSISGQMISKKKRKILGKLKDFFLE